MGSYGAGVTRFLARAGVEVVEVDDLGRSELTGLDWLSVGVFDEVLDLESIVPVTVTLGSGGDC